jgi:hypothetical protein
MSLIGSCFDFINAGDGLLSRVLNELRKISIPDYLKASAGFTISDSFFGLFTFGIVSFELFGFVEKNCKGMKLPA